MPSKKLKIKCKSDCIVRRTIKNLNDGNSMMMLKIISVWKNLVRGNMWIFYLILKDTQDTGELVHIEYGEVFIWKIVLGTYIIQLHQMLLLFILSCQFYSSLYNRLFFFIGLKIHLTFLYNLPRWMVSPALHQLHSFSSSCRISKFHSRNK